LNDLKVIVKNPRNYQLLQQHIEMQLRKFLMCIACEACSAVCPNNAINMLMGDYYIDEEKCTQCGTCVSAWDKGCLIAGMQRIWI